MIALPLRLISPLSSSLGVPFPAATTGPAAAPFVTYSPGPLPARSIHQVCPPLLFPSAVRNGAPQTLTNLFVFGSYHVLCWVRPWFDWVLLQPCPTLKSALENVLWSFYLPMPSSSESPVLLLVSHQEFPVVFRAPSVSSFRTWNEGWN